MLGKCEKVGGVPIVHVFLGRGVRGQASITRVSALSER
jgi:hypothetical protein